MDDKFNTIAGWVLFGGIVALGFSSVSGHLFKTHAPEESGYEIVAAEEGEGESGPSLATLLASADLAAGEKVFAKCTACHTINSGGANGIGPNLYGTMGEEIGHGKGGFAFSGALADHGGTWTFENMDAWLASPKAFAPGTKMSFAGLSKPEDRANIIAYLNAQGSNLPLPTPEAPAAEEAGDEAAATTEGETPEGADAADAMTETPVAEEGAAVSN
ncbi:c-type cytochrome [Croceicoccus naphthovorans]|uniref:Cytochrome C n=1 Tax=Croceicoccus naphthovorans TaxID=1348774 RepID=A0A0G3XLD8_9SPHN|nr:cytochrome c family protein [Croceicoccus naphthovorans]AKM11228.1 cytochrome C [Croceicoccus naphthovorans]MBB3989869.1 cytochrome c [Croceicoccus naphthovorans]